MRRARWLLLAAISIIVFAVGSTYYGRLSRMEKDAPAVSKPLRAGIDATAEGWHRRRTDASRRGPNGEPCALSDVAAKSFTQIQEPASFELEGVGLKIYKNCGESFDQVTSAKAKFDTNAGVLYSEGDVDITMGVKTDDAPGNRLIKIHSSGVYFETKTGKVSTDKLASFVFENGDGKAVGADYDPNNHQLHMKSQVELNEFAEDGKTVAMKVETGDLVYFEKDAKVSLSPWARMTRGSLKAEGGRSIVTLEDQRIRMIESEDARGVQDEDGRRVEYSAKHLTMLFNDDGEVSKVTGDQNAHVISISGTGRTELKADRVELAMVATDEQSVLDHALASGHAIVESKPVVKGNAAPPEIRVLKSEVIDLKMRAGGREIENVETHAPGTLEFVPVRPDQPHRVLTGERFWIAYGESNQIQSFRSVKVSTHTQNPPKNGKPTAAVVTSSEEFRAEFEPKTNQVARIEQNTNFQYQEGDRKAQSTRAVLDQKTGVITLTGAARMADSTGAATADRIVMNQKSGDFTAEGHVTSMRLPDKKGNGTPAMLSDAEPMQAKANKMVSTDNNLQIHYEGNAVAWQGANRIQADRLDIDRDDGVLRANGAVVSQFVDKPKKGKDGKPVTEAQTVYTIVKAPSMVYTDEDKLAHYTGGTVLMRPNLNVKAREIRAFLKDAQSDSSLDHAYADGAVVVVQATSARTRTGTSEHTEYYAGEERIVMSGGDPQFLDSVKGVTKGRILTYFTNDGRLLVNGVEHQRAESTLHRHKLR